MPNNQQDINQQVAEAREHFNAGLNFTNQGNYTESVKEYEQAAKIFPYFYEALDNAGFDRMELGDIEGAKKNFEDSLQIEANNYTALCKLGECLLKLGNKEEAKTYFMKAAAAASNPGDAEYAELSAAQCD